MGNLQVAGITKESFVDGPGIRLVVFVQGCHHACVGCHNQHTHSLNGGYTTTIDAILHDFDKNPMLTGVTFSGGEPMLQTKALLNLAKQVKARNKNLMVYTGYTLEQLLELRTVDKSLDSLLDLIDILVDGRYIESQRDLTLPFKGSRNQRVIDMKRFRESNEIIELQF